MTLPYEEATSGQNALADIEKILRRFGCSKYGSFFDFEARSLTVQFEHRGRMVQIKASAAGYYAAWCNHHPYKPSARSTRGKWEAKGRTIANVAIYSILRDWIKGQVTAIETGILSFEGAFLGQLMLPSGRTVLEHVEADQLLPALEKTS